MFINILYDNKLLYKELTEEECRMIMLALAEKVADGAMDSKLINVEVV
jgi:hypothetical protein